MGNTFRDNNSRIEPQCKKMTGGSFDPWECVCSTQWAMRRLLSILRASQRNCNDLECLQDGGVGAEAGSSGDGADMSVMMMTMMWALFAMVLFFTRPASLRGAQAGKSRGDDGGRRDPPDVPPVQ